MSRLLCNAKCWTAVPCPDHPNSLMDPFGRANMGGECCDKYMESSNPRHLWHEHDSTRWYFDPEGWAHHEKNCKECSPEEDDD